LQKIKEIDSEIQNFVNELKELEHVSQSSNRKTQERALEILKLEEEIKGI